ncbi:MAG: hypothetical protein EXR28_05910 [Betaproteobacteria bacterium]|nr:hypothetical protein [Betaproteobacteria bacterium]
MKHRYFLRNASVVTGGQVLEMATVAGVLPLGLEGQVGTLTPGKQADILLVPIAACSGWISPSFSQAYPVKPIRLILPFTAGIGTDVFALKIAPTMGDSMGQPIIAENRTGASGAIGAEAAYKAPPDGYTVLFTASAQTIALRYSIKDLPYDPNGFTPIMAAIEPLIVIVIRPAIPANSMRDFIEHAKPRSCE